MNGRISALRLRLRAFLLSRSRIVHCAPCYSLSYNLNLNLNDPISLSSSSTRASSTISLRHNFSCSSTTRHFYFNRVVHLWNALSTLDHPSRAFNSIKKYITNILWNHFLTNFDPDSPCIFHFICSGESCSQTSRTLTHHPGCTRNWCSSFNNFLQSFPSLLCHHSSATDCCKAKNEMK